MRITLVLPQRFFLFLFLYFCKKRSGNTRNVMGHLKPTKSIYNTVILLAMISCQNNTKSGDDKSATLLDSNSNKSYKESQSASDSIMKIRNQNDPNIWVYDFESDLPIKNKEVNQDTLNPKTIVQFLNDNLGKGNVQLNLIKTSNDTIFVRINDSEYLTQRMGTTGAQNYMMVTTFTLTELKGIKYVNFEFEVGDHASPGTYSRQYYDNQIAGDRNGP